LRNSAKKKRQQNLSEEKISIRNFNSADDLKNEIRQKIAHYKHCKTDSYNISSNGSYISISAKQKE